jgi:hypothetical protein
MLARHGNPRVTLAVYAGLTGGAREVAVDTLLSAGFGAWRLDLNSPRLASSQALSNLGRGRDPTSGTGHGDRGNRFAC